MSVLTKKLIKSAMPEIFIGKDVLINGERVRLTSVTFSDKRGDNSVKISAGVYAHVETAIDLPVIDDVETFEVEQEEKDVVIIPRTEHESLLWLTTPKPIAQVVKKSALIDNLIAQAEADKAVFPNTWFYGWQIKSKDWISADIEFDFYNIFQYRRHIHADIIMQWKQDKIDYPEFWNQLWQWKPSEKKDFVNQYWQILPHNVDTFFQFNCYRQHPHRENIIAYHACSPEDKKRWQYKSAGGEWYLCKGTGTECPLWTENTEYRLLPKTCKVTLQNGTVMEYPEPVREALNFDDNYWAVYANDVKNHNWINDNVNCLLALKIGLIHLTQQAAEQHLAVLQAINSQVAQ